MQDFSIRNTLRDHQDRPVGKAVSDSNRFAGHDNRLAGHIRRVHTHVCEQPDGERCDDCIRRRVR